MAFFGLTFLMVFFGVGMLYEVGMLKSYGATLGKMACGLKVVRADGSELGWGVCFGRFFMWNVVTSRHSLPEHHPHADYFDRCGHGC